MAIYGDTEFSRTLKRLRSKGETSRYKLAQFSGLNEAYVLRLESGERQNPSRDAVIRLGLALAAHSTTISVDDVNELLLAAGLAPLRSRGEPIPGA